VGTVHLDAALLVPSRVAGWAWLRRDGDNYSSRRAESVWNVPGYASFGWVADRLGRRKAFVSYSLAAVLLIPLYAAARSPIMLMISGTLVAFFGTGIFSGSGIVGSEIFPTGVRARALGFTYSGARNTERGGAAGDWANRGE